MGFWGWAVAWVTLSVSVALAFVYVAAVVWVRMDQKKNPRPERPVLYDWSLDPGLGDQ